MGLMFVWLNHPPPLRKNKSGCTTPGTPKWAEENPCRVYLTSSIYICIYKSSNANSTHLNKKAPRWAFPPPPAGRGLAGSGDSPGQGQGHGRDRPHTLRRLAQPRPGCRLGTGVQTTVGLGTVVPGEKQSGYGAGGGGPPRAAVIGTAGQPGPQTAASIKEGKRKTNSGDARTRGVLFTLRRTPTSPAFHGKRWPEKQVTKKPTT